MQQQTNPTIVIDTGSQNTKAGLSNYDFPQFEFPSIVGAPNIPGIIFGLDLKDTFVGKDAMKKRGILTIYNPIQNGFINNWDDMQTLLSNIFYEKLRILPEDYACLLVEPLMNSQIQREKTAQVMFNLFNVPKFFMSNQSVLSMYGAGLTNGTVIDCGVYATNVVPIFQGSVIKNGIDILQMGGNNLTQYLQLILDQKSITDYLEFQMLNELKQNICYVSQNYLQDLSKTQESYYQLPDGQEILLNGQQFQCLEPYFNPQLMDQNGIQTMIMNALENDQMQNDIRHNILLSGGSSLFPGFKQRVQSEVVFELKKINIIETENRIQLPWIGGHILSQLSTFSDMCVSKEQYEEHGDSIIHKCIF